MNDAFADSSGPTAFEAIADRRWAGWILGWMCLGLAVLPALGRADPGRSALAQGQPTREGRAETDVWAEMEDEYRETGKPGRASIADPFKLWNRGWFQFNDKLYFYAIRPVGTVYGWILFYRPVRVGVDNIFQNAEEPWSAVNLLLQGRFADSGRSFVHFLSNTTVGILGLWRPGDALWGEKPPKEDFDQTLGLWGIGPGVYLIWPFMGPSSIRGTFGMVADKAADPFTYYPPGAGVLDLVNSVSLGQWSHYEQLVDLSVDPYTALRDAYIQSRHRKIRGHLAPEATTGAAEEP